MHNESQANENDRPLELIPEFSYESRHEFVERLAYKFWSERGQPLGSPDVDWFAAEEVVYGSLVKSGMIRPSSNDFHNLKDEIYR